MKLTLAATTVALLAAAGCATGDAQDTAPTPDDMVKADSECAEVVGNEYEQAQRPPSIDVTSTERDGSDVVIAGTSRGNTDRPATYEFKCRHSGGTTVLDSMEVADNAASPTTSETSTLTFDDVAEALTDEQYEDAIGGMKSWNAELKCMATAGADYVPESEKPYTSDMQEPTPYLGGYLVGGKISGANGMVALVRCTVDADGEAKVDGFDVVE